MGRSSGNNARWTGRSPAPSKTSRVFRQVSLLGVVDLPQVQDRTLGDVVLVDTAADDTPVLDDAEVAVDLAVLPTPVRSQEHAGIVRPSDPPGKGVGLHYSPLERPPDGTTGTYARKSRENSATTPQTAKVGLATARRLRTRSSKAPAFWTAASSSSS